MKIIFTCLFALLLTCPILILTFNIPIESTNNENRNLTEAPTINWDELNDAKTIKDNIKSFFYCLLQYKNNFDSYFKDNFVLKSFLFDKYKSLKQNIFQTNPIPSKVLAGKDGWFFLGNSFSEVTKESFGLDTLNTNESERIKSNLDVNQKWFKDLGIDYYVAIAPNKHSVYPDLLGVRTSPKMKKEIDQLANLINSNRLIDLGKGFKDKKEQLFLKTNTHWNDLGAYYAYVNLIRFLKPKYPVLNVVKLSQIRDSSVLSNFEDLTSMLGIPANERKTELFVKNKKAQVVKNKITVPENVNPTTYEFRYKTNSNNLKILFFRDSFSSDMIDYVSESFGESVFVWNHMMSKELIMKEKPDIIIHEFIERDIQILSYGTLHP